jgi:hypothetical protein
MLRARPHSLHFLLALACNTLSPSLYPGNTLSLFFFSLSLFPPLFKEKERDINRETERLRGRGRERERE